MYGVINAVVVAPVMIGFAAIIFRHPAFHEDPTVYPALVKLVLFSSMVHQCAFSACSTLPFSIGQVQDAGLIFLSKMAGDIAEATADDSQQVRMATVLVSLSGSTLLLGLALMLTGRLRLAVLVQYLPLPVVGGYLAFIGLYCLEAGLALMSGVQVTSLLGPDCLAQWGQLLQPAALLATLPGVACGVGILLTLRRCNHFLVRPGLHLHAVEGCNRMQWSLQPHAVEAAPACSGACNRMRWRLHPHTVETVTVEAAPACSGGCGRT